MTMAVVLTGLQELAMRRVHTISLTFAYCSGQGQMIRTAVNVFAAS